MVQRGLVGLVFALASTVCGAQLTVNTLPPDVAQKLDQVAEQALEQTGVPSASVAIVRDGEIAYTKGYGKARLDPPEAAEPRHAVFDRVDLEAVHGGGDLAAGTAGEAVARRPGGEVFARPDAGERSNDPDAAVAHVGLSGLLAGRLPDAADAGSRRPASTSWIRGGRRRWTSIRERSGSTRTRTM